MAKHDWEEYKRNWKSDPKLRVMTERILSMPVEDRLRQIEEEADFFANVRPLDGRSRDGFQGPISE